MKKSILILILTVTTILSAYAQDIVYAVNNWSSPQVPSSGITKYTGINPTNNTYTGTATQIGSPITSDALALDKTSGYLYYVPKPGGSNTGNFSIMAIKADGTGTATEVVAPFDLNGPADNTEIFYRRIGIRADGYAYLVATDAKDVVHIARFKTNGGSTAGPVEDLGRATLAGPFLTSLVNGDLAFSSDGTMFVLANQNTTGGISYIYKVTPEVLAAATGPTSNITMDLAYRVLDTNGQNFANIVTGLAVASNGDFYITAQQGSDTGGGPSSIGGLYKLQPPTPGVTVQDVIAVGPILEARAMADITTEYINPTFLPVTFGPVKAKIVNNNLQVDWTTLSEKGNARFEIWVSKDGKNFENAGKLDSKATAGNSSQTLSYSFSKPINETMSLLGLSIFSLSLIALFLNRKNKLLMVFVAFVGLGITSCSRNADQIDANNEGKLFVKIVQIDKDGKSSSSEIVTAYKAD